MTNTEKMQARMREGEDIVVTYREKRTVSVLFSGPCCYFTHMAEGFGQWRGVDLASGQSWALA